MASRKTFSLLVATALFGALAVLTAWWALDVPCVEKPPLPGTTRGACATERLVQGANLLTLGQPEASKIVHPGWFALARAFALAFVALGVVGIASELRDRGREWTRRVRFWRLRSQGRPQTVVIGGGWVGGPLARERAHQDNAVMLLVRDPDDALVIEAGRCGAVVQTGDALSANVRRGLLLHEADEVFIATGDDRRNLDLLGRLLHDHDRCKLGHDVRYYVHLEHPTFEAQFTERVSGFKLPPYAHVAAFSVPVLAAQHMLLGPLDYPYEAYSETLPLLFDERLVANGVGPPVVVVGLGPVGQAVVLYLARFGHFPAGRRLQVIVLTLPGDDPDALLATHPGLAASHEDGTPRRTLAPGGDRWTDAPDDPVTHALDLAFVPVLSPDHAAVFDAALEAVKQADGTARAAVVFCVEERHSASLHTFPAVRLQERLARHFYQDGQDERTKKKTPIPKRDCPYVALYSHLSAEGGLEELLDKGGEPVEGSDHQFPLRIFGQQRVVATAAGVTYAAARAAGDALAKSYQALAHQQTPERVTTREDARFYRSNYEAALFLPFVFRTLHLRFNNERPGSILASFPDPAATLKRFETLLRKGTHELTKHEADELRNIKRRICSAVRRHLDGAQMAVAGHMLHNRWMGERLVDGWRYGERSDVAKQRSSFVLWEKMNANERAFDFEQVGHGLLRLAARGKHAHLPPTSPPRP